MKSIKVKPLFAAITLLLSVPAQAELTGNITLTSDYIFRGFTQTDQKPAVQGGFEYTHETGLYAGIWASNVELGNSVNIEVDYTAGLAGKVADIDWDFGAIYYDYPSDAGQDLDYTEYKAALTWKFFSFEYYYSDDFFGNNTDEAHYFSLTGDYDLPMDLGLSVHAGHQTISDGDDYDDWSVGMSRSIQGVDLSVVYSDTRNVRGSCKSLCDSRFVFSISKEL